MKFRNSYFEMLLDLQLMSRIQKTEYHNSNKKDFFKREHKFVLFYQHVEKKAKSLFLIVLNILKKTEYDFFLFKTIFLFPIKILLSVLLVK